MVTTCKKLRAQEWTWSGNGFTRQTPSEKQLAAPKPSLVYKRARYYDPQLGQFISRDPLGYVDGMSQYRAYFVPGAMDPWGLNKTNCCYASDFEGPIPPGGRREITIKVDAFELVEKRNPTITFDQMKSDIAEANKIFKKCCVKIELGITQRIQTRKSEIYVPALGSKMEWLDIETGGRSNSIDAHEYNDPGRDLKIALFEARDHEGYGIPLVYVQTLKYGTSHPKGLSTPTFADFRPETTLPDGRAFKHRFQEDDFPSHFLFHPLHESIVVNIGGRTTQSRGRTIAHEVFHIETGFQWHFGPGNNLMGRSSKTNLWDFQCKALRGEQWWTPRN